MDRMRAAVVFHSVSGNTYTLAKRYHEALLREGFDADLMRVADETIEQMSRKTYPDRTIYREIERVPVGNPTQMARYDAIFMGTPTYFGNLSSQMKRFWEGMYDMWSRADLAGIFFGAFATVATEAGGVAFGMMGMTISALHMGLIPLPVPSTVKNASVPAYGIPYHSAPHDDALPGEETLSAIDEYIAWCAPIIRGERPRRK